MSFPKIIVSVAVLLFGGIFIASLFKGDKSQPQATASFVTVVGDGPVEVGLDDEPTIVAEVPTIESQPATFIAPAPRSDENLPDANRIAELFNIHGKKFPFIETITYKSRVAWQKGRPAWLSDYAGYYKTSRHFIARSLNGKVDYIKQNIANGDRFNVFKKDSDIEFYLTIDTSRCKLWFYVLDRDTNERTLLKTYPVGLGRVESTRTSGLLTPLGRYSIGEKIGIYRSKSMGFYNNERTEMIKVFGTRWLPFEHEFDDATEPAKGLGIHGAPWQPNENGEFVEVAESIGKYESDGCIRLSSQDMEELFAIIITKPTTVELVRDFSEAHLPGVESP